MFTFVYIQTIKFLTSVSGLDANTANLGQMTPDDILNRTQRSPRDSEIHKYLKMNKLGRQEDSHDKWLKQTKSSLMVVAILIATIAFQIMANPPSGVWQDHEDPTELQSPAPNAGPRMWAGESIFAWNYTDIYEIFSVVNTLGFFVSLSIILLLVSELPFGSKKLLMWLLIGMTWFAIISISVVYVFALFAVTPGRSLLSSSGNVAVWCMIGWAGLIVLIVISHGIRLMLKAWRKISGLFSRGPTATTLV
ncbi:Unknown protein [Striga hermonthica]|uniref:PGG domain-containing protein n=1 Tax=Striga hermonthica TaxID=68872 RepID=A0A9N7RRN3_STRHE|nr:Unknown protein [Striga hermonthica]